MDETISDIARKDERACLLYTLVPTVHTIGIANSL